MKRLIMAGLLLAQPLTAADLTITKTMESNRDIEELAAVITDYSQFCNGRCAYVVPSIKRFKVLEENANTKFMWQLVETSVSSSVYYKSVLNRKENGQIVINITYPDANELNYLNGTYKLESSNPFDTFKATWTLTPKAEGTSITFSNYVASRNLARPSFRNIIQTELTKTANDYLRNLDLGKIWQSCPENRYCKNGWGWLEPGESAPNFGGMEWQCSEKMELSWKGEGCSCRC